MSGTYRKYNDFVPHYLHGRPRQIIIHCLDRKSSSRKYTSTDICTMDTTNGKFTIQGSSKLYSIDFGVSTGNPSCSCPDWLQWQIPCKHFFAIFRLVEGWGWDSLPQSYKSAPYMCADNSALSQQALLATAGDSTDDNGFNPLDNTETLEDPLPTKKVRFT